MRKNLKGKTIVCLNDLTKYLYKNSNERITYNQAKEYTKLMVDFYHVCLLKDYIIEFKRLFTIEKKLWKGRKGKLPPKPYDKRNFDVERKSLVLKTHIIIEEYNAKPRNRLYFKESKVLRKMLNIGK